MKDYAKLWLAYAPKKNNRDCAALKKIVISGVSESDAIVKNAVTELRSGLKSMLDTEPEITYAAAGTDAGIHCGKDMQDNEEYSISKKEGGLLIEAKSGSGILYGAFDILRTVACETDVEKTYSAGKTVRPWDPLRMLIGITWTEALKEDIRENHSFTRITR